MKKHTVVRKRNLALALLFGAAAFVPVTKSFAQTNASSSSSSNQTVEMGQVVVTGSLMPQAEAVTPNPVITLDAVQFDQSGASDTLDFFRKQTPYFFGNANIGKEIN